MRQAEAAQMPPDRDAVGLDAMPVPQLDHQFIQRQIALLLNPAFDPTRHAREFAMPAAITLRLGLQRAGRPLQKHNVIDKLDRNPELRRWSPVAVTFLNKINDALAKLNRKWFAHQ